MTVEISGHRFQTNDGEGSQDLRWPVVVEESALPAGASTSALQTSTSISIIAAIVAVGATLILILANQTNATQQTKITDATNIAAVVQNVDADVNLDGLNGVVADSVLYGRVGADSVKPLQIDAATHTLQTIDYEHHEIHSESHYFVTGWQDLSINNVLDFTWQMPDSTTWSHWTWRISTESETLWQIYEVAVATNPLANAVTPYNNNRNSGNTSVTTMKFELQSDLAAANADTDVSGGTLIASGISGSGRDGGFVDRSHEVILKQNTLYCLRATASAAGFISFDMQWYEHVNKE